MSSSRGGAALQLPEAVPLFAPLGDATRLRLLGRLSVGGPLSITRLSEGTGVTRQAITRHLYALGDVGLVRHARRGRERVWDLNRGWTATSNAQRKSKMRKSKAILLMTGLLCSLTASAGTWQGPTGTNGIEPLPRDLEIQLALSALPPQLRNNATVYVLNPEKGFEVARKGTDGFYALVARTGDDAFRGSWPLTKYRDDILYPVSFDAAGAKAQLRVFLNAAEMQARGTPPGELKKTIQARYKTGYYKAPERAGVSYMLSPVLRTYFNPEQNDSVLTLSIPHVMYYAPDVSSADIGAGNLAGMYPFVIMPGHHGYMVQLLGRLESEAIAKEGEDMLARLCGLKAVWCLPKAQGQ